MNNMLNETSSFDSFDLLVDDRDGIVSEDGDAEGFHRVTSESEDSGSGGSGSGVGGGGGFGEGTGVLIVPPSRSAASSRQTDLSVPDSVPSDLHHSSLLRGGGGLPNPVLVRGYVVSGGDRDDDDEGTQNNEPDLFSGAAQSRAGKSLASENDSLAKQLQQQHYNLFFFMFAVIAVISVSLTLYLVRESGQLKEQVRDLQALKHAYMQSHSVSSLVGQQEERTRLLEDQVRRLLEEAATAAADRKTKKKSKSSRLNTAKSISKYFFPWDKEDFSLTDNCWVRTQAKMELGECAREATETVKKQVQSVGKSIHAAHDRAWDKFREDYQEMKDRFNDRESYQEMKDRFYKQPPPPTANKPPQSNSTDAEKNTTNIDFMSVTKSILTTAALGSAAAILVYVVDSVWKKED